MPVYKSVEDPYWKHRQLEQLGALGLSYLKQKQEERARRHEQLLGRVEMAREAVAKGMIEPDDPTVQANLIMLRQVDPATADLYETLFQGVKRRDVLGTMAKKAEKLARPLPPGQPGPTLPPQQALQSVYQRAMPAQQLRAQAQVQGMGLSPEKVLQPPGEEGLPEFVKYASQEMRDPYIAQKYGLALPPPKPLAVADLNSEEDVVAALAAKRITPEQAEELRDQFRAIKATDLARREKALAARASRRVGPGGTRIKPAEVTARVNAYVNQLEAAQFSGGRQVRIPGMDELTSKVRIQMAFEAMARNPIEAELLLEEYVKRTSAGEEPSSVYDDIEKRSKSGKFSR